MLLDQSIIDQRAEEAIQAEIIDLRYEELLEQESEFKGKLKEMVSKARRGEFLKISEEVYDVEVQKRAIELKLTYQQGFMDALEIAALLILQKK